MTDLTVELERHFQTEETSDGLALVLEEQRLRLPDGTPLLTQIKRHAIDRKTMEFRTDYPETWRGKEGLIDRAGLVLGWHH